MNVNQSQNISNLMDLRGRIALITGGAGKIAFSIADTLAELGASLCLVDQNEEGLEASSKKINDKWGVEVFNIVTDLEDPAEREKMASDLLMHYKQIDILINNAGFVGDSKLTGWTSAFEEQKLSSWRSAIEVNVTAAFHLSQLFAPQLKEKNNGSIINISSIYGTVGPNMRIYENTEMGNPAAYAVSKSGLIQLTRWLSTVLAPSIRVNCISPGGLYRGQPEVFVDKYKALTPLNRMGREEDIKGAIAYFSSDLSAWVTGQNLMVDGGWTVW